MFSVENVGTDVKGTETCSSPLNANRAVKITELSTMTDANDFFMFSSGFLQIGVLESPSMVVFTLHLALRCIAGNIHLSIPMTS